MAELGRLSGLVRRARRLGTLRDLDVYRDRPVAFMAALKDPETGRPFVVYDAQRVFLERALILGPDGRLPFPELVYSAPKKSGKTATAAIALLYVVRVIGGRFAEGFTVANDYDQSVGRVFQAAVRILRANPQLLGGAKVTKDSITWPDTGASITAIPADYAGAAGSNPNISVFDELWGYTSERSFRLWDEMVPPPTRTVATRLTVSYAGFEGESKLLQGLYTRLMAGRLVGTDLYEAPGLLGFWSHVPVAPWQTPEWIEQMRGQLRPNAFLRMIENRFVSSESGFVPIEWWDACVDPALRPAVADQRLPLWLGVDASVKRDSTAIVAVTWDESAKRVRLVWHRVWQPSPSDPLDFERTVEEALKDLRLRFPVREVRYDPYQLVSSAQRLARLGLRMVEFPQTAGNLTEASQNLYDLLKGRNVAVYPDDEFRLALSRAVAKETPRGWRIGKEKQSHKVDLVVALGMACLGCVQAAGRRVSPDAYVGMADALKIGTGRRNPLVSDDFRLGGFGGRVWAVGSDVEPMRDEEQEWLDERQE